MNIIYDDYVINKIKEKNRFNVWKSMQNSTPTDDYRKKKGNSLQPGRQGISSNW